MRITTQIVLKRPECKGFCCHHSLGYVRVRVQAELGAQNQLRHIRVVGQECLTLSLAHDSLSQREKKFIERALREAAGVCVGALSAGVAQ